MDSQTNRKAVRQTPNIQTDKLINEESDKQTDRLINEELGRQTVNQGNISFPKFQTR